MFIPLPPTYRQTFAPNCLSSVENPIGFKHPVGAREESHKRWTQPHLSLSMGDHPLLLGEILSLCSKVACPVTLDYPFKNTWGFAHKTGRIMGDDSPEVSQHLPCTRHCSVDFKCPTNSAHFTGMLCHPTLQLTLGGSPNPCPL